MFLTKNTQVLRDKAGPSRDAVCRSGKSLCVFCVLKFNIYVN